MHVCQDLRIAHNIFAARNVTGELRVVVWPRRSAYGAKASSRLRDNVDKNPFDIAVAELAGMLVLPYDAGENSPTPEELEKTYSRERLDRRLMTRLETALLLSSP